MGLMQPELSIVFVNYNSAGFLATALASLRQAEPDLAVEIIVVDNASQDPAEVVTVCQRHNCQLVMQKRNRGYGAAANRGFQAARGEFLAVANPDLVFEAPVLTPLVRFLKEHPRVGVVSPQLLYRDGTPQPSARRFPRLRYVFAGRRSVVARLLPRLSGAEEFQYAGIATASEPVPVEAVIGTLMVFRRQALEQVGGFDEGFFLFAEDIDICRRLHQKGWQVFVVPTVKIVHAVGQVRWRFRRVTEFYRMRSLRRLFLAETHGFMVAVIQLLFVCYLSIHQAAELVGISEFEYSWTEAARTRRKQ